MGKVMPWGASAASTTGIRSIAVSLLVMGFALAPGLVGGDEQTDIEKFVKDGKVAIKGIGENLGEFQKYQSNIKSILTTLVNTTGVINVNFKNLVEQAKITADNQNNLKNNYTSIKENYSIFIGSINRLEAISKRFDEAANGSNPDVNLALLSLHMASTAQLLAGLLATTSIKATEMADSTTDPTNKTNLTTNFDALNKLTKLFLKHTNALKLEATVKSLPPPPKSREKFLGALPFGGANAFGIQYWSSVGEKSSCDSDTFSCDQVRYSYEKLNIKSLYSNTSFDAYTDNASDMEKGYLNVFPKKFNSNMDATTLYFRWHSVMLLQENSSFDVGKFADIQGTPEDVSDDPFVHQVERRNRTLVYGRNDIPFFNYGGAISSGTFDINQTEPDGIRHIQSVPFNYFNLYYTAYLAYRIKNSSFYLTFTYTQIIPVTTVTSPDFRGSFPAQTSGLGIGFTLYEHDYNFGDAYDVEGSRFHKTFSLLNQ